MKMIVFILVAEIFSKARSRISGTAGPSAIRIFQETASRNIYLTVYLKQILSEFQNHGVFVLPFKGPVLGEQIYKDSMLRPFSDLDILVGPSDALQAADLLKAKGMIPQMELDVPQFKKYVKDEDNLSFYDTRNKISVELHWDMAGIYLSQPVTIDGVKAHQKNEREHWKTHVYSFSQIFSISCSNPRLLCGQGPIYSQAFIQTYR